MLKSILTRSENDLKGNYSIYCDRYISMYPHMVEEIQQSTQNHTEQIRQIMNLRYSEILDRLLSNLENVISQDISEILRNQLDFLKILL